MIIFLFFRVRAARHKYLGHSTQTDCGSCSADPKIHHPAKRSLAMCERTGGVLRDFVLVFPRDICREHSLIGRRNCVMTEAANSISAVAGSELSIARNHIANLGSDLATSGFARIRLCVLWRPGTSVGRTQAERWLYCTTPCVGMIFTQPRFQYHLGENVQIHTSKYNFYFVGDATQVDNNSDNVKVTAQMLPE